MVDGVGPSDASMCSPISSGAPAGLTAMSGIASTAQATALRIRRVTVGRIERPLSVHQVPQRAKHSANPRARTLHPVSEARPTEAVKIVGTISA